MALTRDHLASFNPYCEGYTLVQTTQIQPVIDRRCASTGMARNSVSAGQNMRPSDNFLSLVQP